MPTYDYVCEACHHEFELFQPITDSPKRKCPKCGKKKLRRLIGTGAAIMFKGSGFYQTDYRSDSYKKRAEADKSASTSGDGKSETKSADKSENKTGSKSESKAAPGDSSSGGQSESKQKSAKRKP